MIRLLASKQVRATEWRKDHWINKRDLGSLTTERILVIQDTKTNFSLFDVGRGFQQTLIGFGKHKCVHGNTSIIKEYEFRCNACLLILVSNSVTRRFTRPIDVGLRFHNTILKPNLLVLRLCTFLSLDPKSEIGKRCSSRPIKPKLTIQKASL